MGWFDEQIKDRKRQDIKRFADAIDEIRSILTKNNSGPSRKVSESSKKESITKAGGAPRVYTINSSKYTSGDTPKYAVGQHVQIEADFSHTKIPCEVLSVSKTKSGGLIYKEFVYSVVILPFPGSYKPKLQSLIGKEYTEVYESCLFE